MAKRNDPPDEPGQPNKDASNDADNFGLPEIEYKPLDQRKEKEKEKEGKAAPSYSDPASRGSYKKAPEPAQKTPTYSYMDEEPKSKAPVIIGIAVAVVVLVAAFLIYQYVYKPQRAKEQAAELAQQQKARDDAERARQEQLARDEEARRAQARLDSLNATPAVGTIETLSDRTRRYYVVISSAIDGDLVMDYAKRLSAKGVSTKIIPPFDKYKFSRLAIGDYDTFATAQSSADAAKTEYGSAVWVLKF
jgi:hypothetical protein